MLPLAQAMKNAIFRTALNIHSPFLSQLNFNPYANKENHMIQKRLSKC